MTRSFVRLWLLMLGLLAVQVALALLHAGPAAPLLALGMTSILVLGPMRLLDAPPLAWIFALGGVFWLFVILFGLGTLEPLPRHHAPSELVAAP